MKILALTPDEPLVQQLLASEHAAGIELTVERRLAPGLQRLKEPAWSMVLVDSSLVDHAHLTEVIERVAATGQRVVLLARAISVKLTLDALDSNVWDILSIPVEDEELRDVLARGRAAEASDKRPANRRSGASGTIEPLIGESPAMGAVLQTATRVADSTTPVFIQGEAGTGKTLLARWLHERSRRRNQPFVTVSCGMLPDQMLESDLFGFEKGAFAGAVARRAGAIERAAGGTLALDDVVDMSQPLQAKLARALHNCEFERLGGRELLPVDVRLVATTTRSVEAEVASGRFRKDLDECLSVVVLTLPPLRQRDDDISLLAKHCIERGAPDRRWQVETIADETLALLRRYPWPGNVRELCNVMERALFMADGPVLLPAHLPADIRNYQSGLADGRRDRRVLPDRRSHVDRRSGGASLRALQALEREHIRRALGFTGGRLGRAADLLGIHRNTLRRKLREWGLHAETERAANGAEPEEIPPDAPRS